MARDSQEEHALVQAALDGCSHHDMGSWLPSRLVDLIMELERYYAECEDCCSGFSAYDQFKVNDWADLHEFEYKHKVKIEWQIEVTDPRSW